MLRSTIKGLLLAGAVLLVSACTLSSAAPPTVEPLAVDLNAVVDRPTRTPTPPPTATLTPSATPSPAPTATVTPQPYTLEAIPPNSSLGVVEAHLITHQPQVEPISPYDLILPHENLLPHIGRFLQPRNGFTHLGSDYRNPQNDMMSPPSDEAILLGTMQLTIFEYTAIALDMAGEVQMYLVELETSGQYIFCFAHLRRGSNAAARQQALANNGRVREMGQIARYTDTDLSDLHIAVIDVDLLYDFTGQDDLPAALRLLLDDTLPRTQQKYIPIYVRPETVWPALEQRLRAFEGVVPQD